MLSDTSTAISAWLQQGDQSAANWLVETHRPLVMSVIRGWLPRDCMVEDVVQEVFTNAFRAMPRLAPERRFESWLIIIARNTCAKALRSWKRRFIFNAEDIGLTDFDTLAVTCPEPEEAAGPERDAALRRLLERLHEQDRRILYLYHVQGLTAHGVGEQLGLSPGAVRVRVCRSQRTLRTEAMRLRNRGEI